jgi:hypothetical protein
MGEWGGSLVMGAPATGARRSRQAPANSAPDTQRPQPRKLPARPPTTTPRLTRQVLRQHRQHAYLRRFLQRSEDLPRQGASRRRAPQSLFPPPPHVAIPYRAHTRNTPTRPAHDDGGGYEAAAIDGHGADGYNRASSSSVVTARSSVSRTERPSPFSSSARTPARSHGRLCTGGCTRRASLRLVRTQGIEGSRRGQRQQHQQ